MCVNTACKRCFDKADLAATSHEGEPDSCSAPCNTLELPTLKDSLDRLHDIHEIEASRSNAASWGSLSSEEKRQKEHFYASQQHTARGFLRMAVSTLKWLNTLAEHSGVVRLKPPGLRLFEPMPINKT